MTAKLIRFFLIALVASAAAYGVAAQKCTRHVEPQGGFSICVPDGWTVRESTDKKYKKLFAPPLDGVTANINFKDEVSSLPLSDYVAEGHRQVLAGMKDMGATSIESMGQSNFTTDSGLRGFRTVFHMLFKDYLLRTIQYSFNAGRNRKLVITCTGMQKNKEVFDPIFDRSLKSFRLVP